jgi:thiol-disulfide isomerase/thioredoxin
LAILLSGCGRLAWLRRGGEELPGPRVGQAAPELAGEDFNGQSVNLRGERGKVVVVVFWASWCAPCRAMIPHERELAERHRGKPFTIISVNNDADHDEAREVIAEQRMAWPHVKTAGTRDPINQRWGVNRWPTMFVIDGDGIIRARPRTAGELDAAIDTLLRR